MHMHREICIDGCLINHLLDGTGADLLPSRIDEEIRMFGFHELRSCLVQIQLNQLSAARIERNHAFLGFLSEYLQGPAGKIDVLDLQTGAFADPESACIHDLDHAAVAHLDRIREIKRIQQLFHLIKRQIFRQLPMTACAFE